MKCESCNEDFYVKESIYGLVIPCPHCDKGLKIGYDGGKVIKVFDTYRKSEATSSQVGFVGLQLALKVIWKIWIVVAGIIFAYTLYNGLFGNRYEKVADHKMFVSMFKTFNIYMLFLSPPFAFFYYIYFYFKKPKEYICINERVINQTDIRTL